MKTNTKNLVHINEASKLLGLTEKELNDLVEGKKIDFVVSSMTKKIKQSTIAYELKVKNSKNLLMQPLEEENIWSVPKMNLNDYEL